MLGVYNYTVILTYIGMLMGFTGIAGAMGGHLHTALLCLMMAGFCDMFDGKVASTKTDRTPQEKRFGIQIDSLSDLICFGVLPAVTVFSTARNSVLTFVVAGLFALCALVRLAWFNVDEEERQNSCDDPREFYLGLPVTTAALFLPTVLGLGEIYGWNLQLAGTIVLVAMGVAFLTPFQLKKPQTPGKIGMILCGCCELLILLVGVKS